MGKILIAEDSDTELAFLNEILKETNHELTITRDGLEAEAAAKAGKFDLIILDVIMPGKNGFQVCRTLKKDPAFKDTPIILLTSKSENSDKFWGMKQGAEEYITKPYNPVDLLLAIRQHMGAN
ncbi:response regulator [Geopsychrobacter electrodiphilus]|uniref:response regulator n=1 Tax=Geopsychrobacter electrodiphilus TaxID=225196 RepID=UPI000476FB61|nr:response regulator [Geopsychrobacter electrodiphilus]